MKRYQRNGSQSQSIVARGGVRPQEAAMSQSIVTGEPATVEFDLMPINPDWVLEGAPRARAKVLASSEDGTIWIMAWDCSAGRFRRPLRTKSSISSRAKRLSPTSADKSSVSVPAIWPSSTSTWHVPVHVRKLAVLHHAMPVSLSLALRALRRARRLFPSKYIAVFRNLSSGG